MFRTLFVLGISCLLIRKTFTILFIRIIKKYSSLLCLTFAQHPALLLLLSAYDLPSIGKELVNSENYLIHRKTVCHLSGMCHDQSQWRKFDFEPEKKKIQSKFIMSKLHSTKNLLRHMQSLTQP